MSADPRPTQSLAALRLDFSPSYILVGVYRLSTDPAIRAPVWAKCKHGFVRGALVGLAWVSPPCRPPPTISQPTTFPRRVLPGILHVWNSKELHPTLPVKVRPALVTNHRIHFHPPHARSASVTGLSHRSFFGYTVPFELTTCMCFLLSYATSVLISQFIRSSGRSARRRRSSEFHPRLLSPEEYSHCQTTSVGADCRL